MLVVVVVVNMAQATCQNCGSEIDLQPGKADGKVDGEVVVHTYGSNVEPDMIAKSDYYCDPVCLAREIDAFQTTVQ